MVMQMFTSKQYLKIDIANNFGLEKENWDVRIAWFDKNENQLQELVNQAEEPALFYAGIKAWEDVQNERPTGYMISLDATSSGLQLLAALTGDSKAAKLCNVVDTGKREDAYTGVYVEMLGRINDTAKISRDDCKEGVMTSLYGSTAIPKKVFGEGKLLDIFFSTMKDLAPAAWELNETMLALWNPDAYSNDWVLPDNFHVQVKVMGRIKETVHFLNQPFDVFTNVNMPMDEGRSLGANTIHSVDGMIVREISRRCDYNPVIINNLKEIFEKGKTLFGHSTVTEQDQLVVTLWDHYKECGYLSARILDYLEPKNMGHVDTNIIRALINSLPDKPFKVIAIHD